MAQGILIRVWFFRNTVIPVYRVGSVATRAILQYAYLNADQTNSNPLLSKAVAAQLTRSFLYLLFSNLSAYQIPLSLPVIFCPKAAAVARHGNKLSRTVLPSSPLSINVVNSEA